MLKFIHTSTYEQKSFVAVYTMSKSFMYCLKIWQGKSWLLDDSFSCFDNGVWLCVSLE